MMFFAVLLIMNTPLFGIVLGLCSSFIFVYQKGVEVNPDTKEYRYFLAFGPQETGKWENLPEIDYISVFAATYASSVSGVTSTKVTMKQQLLEVNLITTNKKRINICITKDREEAFSYANKLAQAWSLSIYDATSREPVWIEPA